MSETAKSDAVGTEQARFVGLLQANQGILHKVAFGYCRDAGGRGDLLQEMAAQAWRGFARYDERVRFSTWLYRVALNTGLPAIDHALITLYPDGENHAAIAEISNARQLIRTRGVDLGGGMLEVQTALQRLALERIQVTLGTLLLAPLRWAPLLIMGLRALGIDAYATLGARSLLANLLVGAALIPVAIGLSRRYAARMKTSPRLRRLLDQVAGYSLMRARAALGELSSAE